MSEFIYGEELVIITNQSITNDDDKILSMISTMNEKNVADEFWSMFHSQETLAFDYLT